MKTTYVDGAIAPLANTGQIKLHGPEAFAAMRKAGRLTAEALDLLCDHVRPGVTTDALDQLVRAFALEHGAVPAPLYYRGYPQLHLHLDQPCRVPRHPQRQAAARGRHRQYRRHADRRWLAWRFEPHVSRSARSSRKAEPG